MMGIRIVFVGRGVLGGGFKIVAATLLLLSFLARLHQLRGLGDAKVLKSLGHSPKGRHYRG